MKAPGAWASSSKTSSEHSGPVRNNGGCANAAASYHRNMPTDVVEAIRRGDLSALESLLAEKPEAARDRIDGQRTLLHVATDWPGHFPSVQQTIQLLARHGAELNAPFHGPHAETPLHWAAFHGNVTMAKLLLARNPPMEAEDADFHSTPLGWAIHGSENGWHCRTGDYAATAEALIVAGAKVPEKTEGTEAVRDVLRRHRPKESNSQHSPA